MKIGVVVFPGSNCDHDMQQVFGRVLGGEVTLLWHKDREIGKQDIIVVPGGFSYGDYLRTGALAKLSPVMDATLRASSLETTTPTTFPDASSKGPPLFPG